MYGAEEGSFPIAERMANRVVSLPIFPSMKDEEVMYVCEAIRSYYER
jgi:dTDP-4-amino-4,6-dideoxygalactose transaminase